MANDISEIIARIADARRVELRHGAAGAALVAQAVDRIRAAYHRDWESQKLGRAEALLARLSDGMPVPALSICGHGTAETRYTQYLAYFLDPSKLHGLDAAYLDAVLALIRCSNPSLPDQLDLAQARVWPELRIGRIPGSKGRTVACDCDVVVEFPGHVIFIEHKINSGQSPNAHSDDHQLKRYDLAIEGNPRFRPLPKTRVYLSPSGKDSMGSHTWSGLSHDDLASAGLGVIRAGGLSETARENLRRFIVDVLLGPYAKAEGDVLDLRAAAKAAIGGIDFSARLRFDGIASRNRLLVDLLLEG